MTVTLHTNQHIIVNTTLKINYGASNFYLSTTLPYSSFLFLHQLYLPYPHR